MLHIIRVNINNNFLIWTSLQNKTLQIGSKKCVFTVTRQILFFHLTLKLFSGKFLKIYNILEILSFSGIKWDNIINNS